MIIKEWDSDGLYMEKHIQNNTMTVGEFKDLCGAKRGKWNQDIKNSRKPSHQYRVEVFNKTTRAWTRYEDDNETIKFSEGDIYKCYLIRIY